MPKALLKFLKEHSLGYHFFVAMSSGLFFRLLSAYFVYGPQALDDYKHGVYPAYQFYAGLPLDLPEYRSHLLIWILALPLKIAGQFGVQSALGQVRAMYMGLAVLSLLGIYGTYLFVRADEKKIFSRLALYFVALFPLMPFVSTRAFGEAVAMTFVLLGIGLIEGSRRRNQSHFAVDLLGFIMLSVAVWLRFHVGVVYVTYLAAQLILRRNKAFAAGIVGGLIALGGQAGIDLLSHKYPFETLVEYLRANGGGAAQYGVSPWYNTWAFMLALTLPPFSFVLFRKFPELVKRHWPWVLPLLIYILVHSLVPHKEERFLYPVVGLELWAVAWLWSEQVQSQWVRRIYAWPLLVICSFVLPVICLINTQEGEIEPPALAEQKYGQVIYLDSDSLFGISRIQFYFLRPPSVIQPLAVSQININSVQMALTANPWAKAAVILTSEPDRAPMIKALEQQNWGQGSCGIMQKSGSILDSLLYRLNPKHNQRRRPTWFIFCDRGT